MKVNLDSEFLNELGRINNVEFECLGEKWNADDAGWTDFRGLRKIQL